MKIDVTSDRAQTVDGLGVFAEGETKEFTKDEADRFTGVTGLQLRDGNVPQGVSVTIVVGGEE